jgi:hypothetical protein
MLSENKSVRAVFEDDLSTSPGSSDNEAAPSSEDEGTPSMLISGHDTAADAEHAIIWLMVLTVWQLCTLLFSSFFGVVSRPKKAALSPNQRALAAHKPVEWQTAPTVAQKAKPAGTSAATRRAGLPTTRSAVPSPPERSFREPPGLEATTSCPLKNASRTHTATVKQKTAAGFGTDVPRKGNAGQRMPAPKVPPAPVQAQPQPAATRLQPPPPLPKREFELAAYRKELSDVLRDLANGATVAAAVRRIRAQSVPRELQATEFSDILTRVAEENRGVARRISFAFATALAIGEPNSAFEREECAVGVQLFFEGYEDLAAEVPRLRSRLANELTPTLRTVFSAEEVARLVPEECRAAIA